VTQPIPVILGSASSDIPSPAVEIRAQPGLAAEPEPVPELAAEPELTVVPEPAAELEPTVVPELAEEPELTVVPELAAMPELAVEPEPELTVVPELAVELEPAVEPEPTVVPEPAAELADETLADHERAAAIWAQPVRATQQQASKQQASKQQASKQQASKAASRRYRMAGMAASVIILLTASLAFALSRHAATPPAGGGSASPPGAGRATRNLAAIWAAAQVSRTATVSCDPVMCRALTAHGFPADDLLELGHGTAQLLRSDVIVATAAVRGQLGSRLSSRYAPVVFARFGSGRERIDIRAIAPHGVAAYMSALRADMRARKQAGAQLLESNRIVASAPARTQLIAGQVDSRLLITVAEMAALHPVFIVAFGDPAPGADAVSPLRSADLAEANTAPHVINSIYLQSMLAFLHGLNAPYPPSSVGQRRLAGGLHVIHIEFAAPSPLGLVSPQTR
jgi:hypothetical protein